ncbi:MAG TPA: hypothetical protein VNK82_00065 [Terriglobales bacterium]|nr:hypothetical protein [Terriglobales bacterium]
MAGTESSTELLNPYQKHRVLVCIQDADRLLTEIEHILDSTNSRSPFPKYIADVSPRQRERMEESIAAMRQNLLEVLERLDIAVPPPQISALHAVQASLDFVDIAITEMRPKHLRGYGEVKATAVSELNQAVEELESTVGSMYRELNGGERTE